MLIAGSMLLPSYFYLNHVLYADYHDNIFFNMADTLYTNINNVYTKNE